METKKIIIDGCRNCPFYGSSMDGMHCGHSYWDDKGAYDNAIITRNDMNNNTIPGKCPLRIESLTITYTLDINDKEK